MARYRILCWRHIPSLVEASDGREAVQRPLSQRFQDLIDAVAMREGASESQAYLDGWHHGPEEERSGDPAAVAAQVAEELEEGFEDFLAKRFLAPPA
ncbi:MAG TPA: virulence factor [Methylomirabilota bacterium]|nr:virulence factor [Methylomirabilota bacterium]